MKKSKPLSPEDKKLWRAFSRTLDRHKPIQFDPHTPDAKFGDLKSGNLKSGSDVKKDQTSLSVETDGPARKTPGSGYKKKPTSAFSEKPLVSDHSIGGFASFSSLEYRRMSKTDAFEARIDLHGLREGEAREALFSFLHSAHKRGCRLVIIITGKGRDGQGLLRRRLPDWLEDPAVKPLISALSPAGRRHGGDGAFYVRLKRRASP